MKKSKAVNLFLLLIVSITMHGCSSLQGKRVGSVIAIQKGNVEKYRHLSANLSKEMIDSLKSANVRKYAVYLGSLEKDTKDYFLLTLLSISPPFSQTPLTDHP